MTSDRYVPTQAIGEAVKGRETEVLEALAVAWGDRRLRRAPLALAA